jgi:hypothetical protein
LVDPFGNGNGGDSTGCIRMRKMCVVCVRGAKLVP